MGKKRVYELAKEIDISSKEIVDKAQSIGIDVKNHMGSLSEDDEKKIRQTVSGKPKNEKKSEQVTKQIIEENKTQPTVKHHQSNKEKLEQHRKAQASQKQGNYPPKKTYTNNSSNSGRPNTTTNNNGSTRPAGNSSNNSSVKPSNTTNSSTKPATNSNNNTSARPSNTTNSNSGTRPNTNGRSTGTARPSATTSSANNARTNQNSRPNTNSNNNANGNKKPTTAATTSNGPAKPAATTQQSRDNRSSYGGNKPRNSQYGGGYNNQNRNRFNKKGKKGKRQQESTKPAVPPRKYRDLPEVLVYTDGMTVAEISKRIYREPAEIIKKLFMMGIMATLNQGLDKETIELLATDYGIEAEEKVQVDVADIDKFFEEEAINPEKLVARPPVVTIMGHVDHGKTTLLDTLRHTKVTSGEAGGITQHIGAYQIEVEGKTITFLDTPGHAAFTSMRARGAKITDITILVVAADDGVMPQTIEAINHAKAADVPIIVAVNKIDKPAANPDHVMQELTEYGLIPEAWGGDTIFVPISAKFGENLDELLEMILLVAEVQELKADPTQRAIGSVIEARLDKGKGTVATLLVQQGTLRVGDPIVVGNTFGRVRVMTNALGRRDKAAGPATPVEITGLNDVPQAGDRFVVYEDEKTARQAGEERAKRALSEQREVNTRVTLDNLFESLKEGELKEVNVIIKGDVQGSVEALAASLNKIDVEGVRVKIIHTAVGAINESDITLAAASNAIIIGFNVRPTPQAKIQAEGEEVDIRLHRIIYNAIDEIETAMKGMLDPEFEEKITGQMTVRELYKVSKVGTIAGCYVTEGFIRRDSGVRVIRDGIVIYEGQLASLKRFKDDAKEVKLGFECGAMVENFNDLKVDDIIEGYVMEEIKTN